MKNKSSDRIAISLICKLFLLITLFGSCSTFQPLVITEVKNFKTANLLTNPEILFDLQVKNPNKFGVTIKRMGLNVLLAETSIATVEIPGKRKIKGATVVSLPIAIKPSASSLTIIAVSGFMDIFSGKEDKKLDLSGEILIRKFIFARKIKIQESIKL
ncbi:MAG: LEA type 2 family protein [Bacteroidetes bacterium]|nr:LEA type 2 family protein [Bacteroidota bacterium]